MQNRSLEKSLLENQDERDKLRARVAKLEKIVHQYRNRNSVVELQASLSRIEQMKKTIEELEVALQNCEARIEYLEANKDYQSEQLHYLQNQVRSRDRVMGQALVQIREVADHLQTLAVQADTLSVKYELESDQGRELASVSPLHISELKLNTRANLLSPSCLMVEKERVKEELPRQLEERCKWLEEKFKAMEVTESYRGIDAKELSLVPDLVLPHKFKMPEFEKYNGTTCPEAHITMFCRRMAGYMIENAIRSGKIDAGESNRRSTSKRKENEENNAGMYNKGYSKSVTVSQPGKAAANQQSSSRQEVRTRRNTERPQFTPILMSYRELYRNLFDAHVGSPFYLKPLQPPYPKWYDANAQYDYHVGITGHSIENCTTFKKLVERLIGIGVVKFDEATKAENPLPNHTDGGVNMMDEDRRIKVDIADVKTPLRWVWKEMVKRGLIASEEGCEKRRNYCEFHCEMGHEIQECTEFRAVVQGMIDNKEMEFCEGIQKESHVCTSDLALGVPKVNISQPKNREARARVAPRVIIQKPTVFTYKDNRRVPWNYNCNVTIPRKEDHDEGGYDEQMKARVEPIREDTPIGKKKKAVEPESVVNEPIKEEEAREFLKFIKHSEYSVVEQLHKQPARISVLALLLNSEGHRNALLKVLNETYVADDISINKLDRLVGNISVDNFISFSDDKIPPGGMGSTRALHITARCKGCILPGVLVDNGSALNVLPLSTLNRLPMNSSHIKSCQNVVRAFDGTERGVIGRINIPLLIGLTIYEVDFLVMDIKPSYSCLLGRPWIHSAGAVPSSLHQKLKLVSEGRVVTIDAEEDIIASVTNDAPYLETSDDAIECSFCSLEFVNATFIHEGNKIPMPRISRTTEMGLQLTVGKGALPRKGLGRYLQGRVEAPVLKEKQDRFGLGYKPDAR
ncbi:uncharacterized protein LOC128036210 [Gossypium raimondii]|uniref:uncharacterized protein LOC128036210 n=1 Tax=Gossypium raimondii TaxID=29730 RepID=UPI00227BD031|nr:uncharacterized protein LOC128036210 [Gossypium raimondii]